MVHYCEMDSPVGTLLLFGGSAGLAGIDFHSGARRRSVDAQWRCDPHRFTYLKRQLEEYFSGVRREFEIVLAAQGTPFQQSVWNALQAIPYGAVRSYAEIAREIGRPHAFRAVGRANGANPWPIVVPCHRVIGSDRSLTGFGGGIERKQALLQLEARYSAY